MKNNEYPGKYDAAILELEKKQAAERIQLKMQLMQTYEHLKPAQMIQRAFTEVNHSPVLKDEMVNTVIGLSIGFICKFLFIGRSKNPVKKIIGNALMVGITNTVIKHPDAIKTIAFNAYHVLKQRFGNEKSKEDLA
jgi:hypothetical protein